MTTVVPIKSSLAGASIESATTDERAAGLYVAFDESTTPQNRRDLAMAMRALSAIASLSESLTGVSPLPGPATLESLRHREERWRTIEQTWGLLTAAEVAPLLGSKSSNPSEFMRERRKSAAMIAVRRSRRILYPGFQFAVDGALSPGLSDVVRTLIDADWSMESVLFWFTAPNGALPQQATPADALAEGLDREVREVALNAVATW